MQSLHNQRGSADLWWFNKANDLRGATAAISYIKSNESKYIKDEYGFESGYRFSIALSGPLALNAGLSIELLLKAIIIFNNNGEFEKISHSHNLLILAKEAQVLAILNDDQTALLEILTEYIIWAGKYPVAKDETRTEKSHVIFSKMMKPVSPEGKLKFTTVDENRIPNWQNYIGVWDCLTKFYWDKKDI